MKKFVLMGCLLALSGQVMSANWIFLNIDREYIMYGDTESRTDNKAWVRFIHLKTDKPTRRDVKASQFYWQANCSNNQLTLLSGASYNHSGKVIDSFDSPSYALQSQQYVKPDTNGEIVFKFICNREPS